MLRNRQKQLRLNLGCGANKIKGYVNIDTEPSVKPDLVVDFTKQRLPYKNGTVDEIIFFHTIEHIRKIFHNVIISECSRVLKLGGKILISYPNFWECAKRWKDNEMGRRDFWEATIYGRQLFPSDYHVSAIDPDELKLSLIQWGFDEIYHAPEDPPNEFNSVTVGIKLKKPYTNYVDLLKHDVDSMEVIAEAI